MTFPTRALLPFLCAVFSSPALAQSDQCFTGDFDTFLARFSTEIAVQQASTADPLLLDFLDLRVKPDPQLLGDEVPPSEVHWPVMPDSATLADHGLVMEVSDANETAKSVLVDNKDSGVRVTWFFASDPCWTLIRMLHETM